jgi:hypothetical protein
MLRSQYCPVARSASERTIMNLSTRIIAVVAATALMSGGAVAAHATETAASSCTFAEHIEHAFGALPDDLQADLLAISDLPAAERKAAAADIRAAALAGEYGEKVQQRAEKGQQRRGLLWMRLPDDLRADLAELADTDTRDERLALAEQIADEALDGGYGPRVQRVAERMQSSELWQSCEA